MKTKVKKGLYNICLCTNNPETNKKVKIKLYSNLDICGHDGIWCIKHDDVDDLGASPWQFRSNKQFANLLSKSNRLFAFGYTCDNGEFIMPCFSFVNTDEHSTVYKLDRIEESCDEALGDYESKMVVRMIEKFSGLELLMIHVKGEDVLDFVLYDNEDGNLFHDKDMIEEYLEAFTA